MTLCISMKRKWLGLFSILLCLLFLGSLATVAVAASQEKGRKCMNLVDDDNDGDIDCADTGCTPESYCEYPEVSCDDGFDNDGDGLIDDLDLLDCPVTGGEICDNGIDDDGDGLVDCEDHVDCDGQPGGPGGELCAANEVGLCTDGFDNDADGLIDDLDLLDCPVTGARSATTASMTTAMATWTAPIPIARPFLSASVAAS
jgi:hypothetical protein